MTAGKSSRSSSTSTRIVNGQKVTTKKVIDNGVETVSTYENDVLKSQTVNGVPQAVTNQGNDFTVTGREKTGKDVDATAGKETVAGQGAHGGEGGAEEMEKYKNVQTIEEDASAGNETVEGVGGGEGAVEGEKSGDSSSANGETFHLFHFTHS